VSLVIGLSVMRDDGQLKRLRGTPLPPWAFFTGQVVSRLVLVVVEAALVLGLGWLLFHVSLPPSVTAWVTFALVVLLGAATFRVPGSRSAACRTGWPRSPTPSRSPPCWTACGRH
jgi:ABC-2 type transport system permease protein